MDQKKQSTNQVKKEKEHWKSQNYSYMCFRRQRRKEFQEGSTANRDKIYRKVTKVKQKYVILF